MVRSTLMLLSLVAATPLPGAVVLRGRQVLAVGEAGMPLLRTDTVRVPVGGAVFLRVLKNDQVVRLEEDLALPVSALAALDAPRAASSVEQQPSGLLSPRERVDVRQQRLAGWVVRPMAANVPSANGAKRRPRPPPIQAGR